MTQLKQHCHFIGIGGIGMSGLARILRKKNITVSGSDLNPSPLIEQLEKEGVNVFIGHKFENIDPNATIVYSSGVPKDNPEYQAAVELECPILHRSDLLKELMEKQKTLAVAGTHGKTTTSSLLTAVLAEAKLSPSFAIGGVLPQFKTNADCGTGEFFVAEADESDGTFLKYNPYGAILTNIGIEHMNHYGDVETLTNAFQTFITQVKNNNLFFWCADDKRLASLRPKGIGYGFNSNCQLRGSQYRQEEWNSYFDIHYRGKTYENVQLSLSGKHNALNALAVFGQALNLGVSEETIREAFKKFQGVGRRCEKKADEQNVLVVDDYAHHPSEIKTTLAGVRRAIEEKRLIAIFQPHRFSRTKDCLGEYQDTFNDVDLLIVTDIYSAGETSIQNLSHQNIIDEIKQKRKIPVLYAPRDALMPLVWEQLRPHDVLITLGAGDITKFGNELGQQLKKEKIQKWKVGFIYGGRSTEHTVSLSSARNILSEFNPNTYDLFHVGITKEGNWLIEEEAEKQLKTKSVSTLEGGIPIEEAVKHLKQCDIFFSLLHGPFGEDGTIQGFFDMLNIPYTGCCHRSAAVSMDKALAKRVMMLHGIATPQFIDFTETEWKENPQHFLDLILQQLKLPVFVKPVHLGSSVGVTKVESWEELPQAIQNVFHYDNQLLVENGITGRELEFSVLGNENLHTFPPGEILSSGSPYDYEAKYGKNSFDVTAQAELSEELCEEGMFLAEKAFQAMECSGMARVDFFLDEYNRFWFNEVNPIPGFASKSLYPLICAANGLPATKLLDRLIILGFQRKRAQLNYSIVL